MGTSIFIIHPRLKKGFEQANSRPSHIKVPEAPSKELRGKESAHLEAKMCQKLGRIKEHELNQLKSPTSAGRDDAGARNLLREAATQRKVYESGSSPTGISTSP